MSNVRKMVTLTHQMQEVAINRDDEGREKFEARKLAKALGKSKKMGAVNSEVFESVEPKFNTCIDYNPCPICSKCQNKASHLYVKCSSCQIPTCIHTNKDKQTLIKRKNFKVDVSYDTWDKILKEIHRQGGDKYAEI